MERKDVVIGKTYRKVKGDLGDLGWFDDGAVLIINGVHSEGLNIMSASGKAKADNCGGTLNKKGDIIDGYVYARQLEEIEAVTVEPTDVHVSINPNSTTIVIQKRLSIDEVHAVLKAAGV